VGYVLGLGDRHLSNILVDNSTAELVHIDLGIVFDAGKLLNFPEVVPFRLTRDLVDAMGTCGFEGTFKRCCEETARVLRNNEDMLLTVLEVLVYDPLWSWTLSSEKQRRLRTAKSVDSSSSRRNTRKHSNSSNGVEDEHKLNDEVNTKGQTVITTVKQKLRGTEMGGVAMSVEGQVKALIREATDPENLCRLYYGWMSWI